jgi:hypothetical protein
MDRFLKHMTIKQHDLTFICDAAFLKRKKRNVFLIGCFEAEYLLKNHTSSTHHHLQDLGLM